MQTMGGDNWIWSIVGSRSIEFCVWALLQDGLHVRPFDIHPDGHGRLRRAGLNSTDWARWFETVVNHEVAEQKKFQSAGGLESRLFYESDPPTIAEQLEMKEALRANTAPGLWDGSNQVGELFESLWEECSSLPVLRRKRHLHDPVHGEQPGTALQLSELYGSMHEVGSRLPSIYCFPVAYPTLVVHEVAPVALVLTSPKQWTWERYRNALVIGVANLNAHLR
jgi:hypothetical protein